MKCLCGENKALHVLTADATSTSHHSLISKHGDWIDLFGLTVQPMVFSSTSTWYQQPNYSVRMCCCDLGEMTCSWGKTALRSLDPRWINNGLKKIKKYRGDAEKLVQAGSFSCATLNTIHCDTYSTLSHTHTHTVRCSFSLSHELAHALRLRCCCCSKHRPLPLQLQPHPHFHNSMPVASSVLFSGSSGTSSFLILLCCEHTVRAMREKIYIYKEKHINFSINVPH